MKKFWKIVLFVLFVGALMLAAVLVYLQPKDEGSYASLALAIFLNVLGYQALFVKNSYIGRLINGNETKLRQIIATNYQEDFDALIKEIVIERDEFLSLTSEGSEPGGETTTKINIPGLIADTLQKSDLFFECRAVPSLKVAMTENEMLTLMISIAEEAIALIDKGLKSQTTKVAAL